MGVMGERIRDVRTRKRMSQKQLATAVGRKQASISEMERGATAPSNATLEKIAEVLGVPTSFLLGEDSMKYVKRMRGKVLRSEFETDTEGEDFINYDKVVIEKNGARVELPPGTTPEFIAEILKSM